MKKTILMIDDEKDFCFFVSKNLETTGQFCVKYATNPDMGIRMARTQAPDLIVLDINMPRKNGLEVLKILKNDLKTVSIPVIMLTALSDDETREKASWLYNESYLTKPVSCATLRAEIEKVLENTNVLRKGIK